MLLGTMAMKSSSSVPQMYHEPVCNLRERASETQLPRQHVSINGAALYRLCAISTDALFRDLDPRAHGRSLFNT
jgi:hypothetical protein